MVKLEIYISDLLYNHDCVIVPQFGGFVANYAPAKTDTILNKFSPPSKALSFNKSLLVNDGLLANHISIESEVPYEQALSDIRNWVVFTQEKLKDGSKVSLNKIGILFYNNQGNLCFEPDNSVNYLKSSFGLSEFFMPKLTSSKVVPTAEVAIENKVEQKETKPNKVISINTPTKDSNLKKIMRYAAIAFLIPVLSYAIWFSLNFDAFKNGNFSSANLNPFTEKLCTVYTLRQLPLTIVKEEPVITDDLFDEKADFASLYLIEKHDPEFSENEVIIVRLNHSIAEAVTTNVSMSIPDNTFAFHVVGGCFQIFENAEKLVNQLRQLGYNSAIVDRNNGLFRVSYGSFQTRHEADLTLTKAKQSHNPNAWVLVKKEHFQPSRWH